MYYNYEKSKYLGPQAVSLLEWSIIQCPYLEGYWNPVCGKVGYIAIGLPNSKIGTTTCKEV